MAVKKSGLGKGLDSLIPKQSADDGHAGEVLKVKLTEIEPNPEQPRKRFEEDSLNELADSIRQFGVIQPLIVQKKGSHYEIIAGERRWRAAKMAGVEELPIIVKKFSDQEMVELSLIENIQRENLNPIEEAAAYQRLMTEFHLKQDEVAECVSKSRSAVTNSLRLLKLDERVQQMVVDEKISTGHARALLAIEDKDAQYRIAQRIFDEKMSVRDVERLVKTLTEPKKEREKQTPAGEAVYREIADQMKTLLGTKVSIENKKDQKGKIVIDYYSNDDLERILDLFRSIPR